MINATNDKKVREEMNRCKKCGYSGQLIMKNFDAVAREADLHCGQCGAYVRMWNP